MHTEEKRRAEPNSLVCASEGAPACDRNAIPALHHLDVLVKARKMQPAHDESPALSLAASARAAVSDASFCTRLGLVLARARKRFVHTQHIGAEGEMGRAPKTFPRPRAGCRPRSGSYTPCTWLEMILPPPNCAGHSLHQPVPSAGNIRVTDRMPVKNVSGSGLASSFAALSAAMSVFNFGIL